MLDENEFKILFSKYLNGTCSKEEVEQLLEYIKNSQYEQDGTLVMDELWRKEPSEKIIHKFPEGDKLFNKITAAADRQERRYYLPKKQSSYNWFNRAAAVFLILVTAVGLSLYNFNQSDAEENLWMEKHNAYGQKSTITLSDGSEIRLNSGSSLIYPKRFTGDIREVTLTGEAFFKVAKNTEMPFVVKSGDLKTTVLGTSFNIQAYPDENLINVAVLTGRVAVEQIGTKGEAIEQVVLTPDEIANYQHDVLDKSTGDVKEMIAWTEGTLVFDNKNFEEVELILERWYGVEIEIPSDNLKKNVIMGKYTNESLHHILKALQYALDFKYEFTEGRVLITDLEENKQSK